MMGLTGPSTFVDIEELRERAAEHEARRQKGVFMALGLRAWQGH
jgi:hypothetical protein